VLLGWTSEFPYSSFPLWVGSDGAAKTIIFGEFTGNKKHHKTRGNRIQERQELLTPTARSRHSANSTTFASLALHFHMSDPLC
jgi:hypothetical protein